MVVGVGGEAAALLARTAPPCPLRLHGCPFQCASTHPSITPIYCGLIVVMKPMDTWEPCPECVNLLQKQNIKNKNKSINSQNNVHRHDMLQANDGHCDDGRTLRDGGQLPVLVKCDLGSDCADCGPWRPKSQPQWCGPQQAPSSSVAGTQRLFGITHITHEWPM
eukprot:155574-Chlamydomonas_euryale.AAC.2